MIHRIFRPRSDLRTETIWLTIYADLITNMMLVFLALFGLTIMGDDALARAVQSMKFSDLYSSKDKNLNFDDLAPALRQKLRYSPETKVIEEIGAVRIEFGEHALFESGKAELKPSANSVIQIVANLLKTMPQTIVVEGHTDSVPVQPGGEYRDNNELSLARAMSVVHLLIDDGLPTAQMAAAAYGSYRPRASNDTELGRSINRRVEIALFKDFPYVHGR